MIEETPQNFTCLAKFTKQSSEKNRHKNNDYKAAVLNNLNVMRKFKKFSV